MLPSSVWNSYGGFIFMESLPPFTESKFLSCRNKERKLGSNNMIPVGRHEILSRLAGISALHPAITGRDYILK